MGIFDVTLKYVAYLRLPLPKPSSQNDSEVDNFKEMKFRAGRVKSNLRLVVV